MVDARETHGIAEILQQDLAAIGVKVALKRMVAPDFLSPIQEGQFGGAWIASIGFTNLSPATLYASAFPVRLPNSSHFETLIDDGRRETDDRKLTTLVRELTQITLDECFVVPIDEVGTFGRSLEVAIASVKNVMWDDWGWSDY